MKKFYLLLALLALPAIAFANNDVPDAAFVQFAQTIMSWASGPLGTGLAITMMLMGGAMGVARNSPLPALVGVSGAAFLNFMPGILMNMAGIPAVPPAQAAHMLVTSSKTASSAIVAGAPALMAPGAAKVSPASSVKVAVTTTATPTIAAQQIASVPAPQPSAVKQTSELKTLVSHASSLSHTVPVPMAVPSHVTLNAPAVSSSQVTRWVGIGGSVIILTLLGLLMYLSAQRRARTASGFTPSGSTTSSTPTSVFSDPHGFNREKRSPTFGHESA